MTDEAKKLLLDVLTACQAIDDLVVWDIVEQKVPVLKVQAEKLLGESAPE